MREIIRASTRILTGAPFLVDSVYDIIESTTFEAREGWEDIGASKVGFEVSTRSGEEHIVRIPVHEMNLALLERQGHTADGRVAFLWLSALTDEVNGRIFSGIQRIVRRYRSGDQQPVIQLEFLAAVMFTLEPMLQTAPA